MIRKVKWTLLVQKIILAEGNINYELADHCITLKKSGVLSQVESIRAGTYTNQFSTTTNETIKQLPRSSSEEIFDRVKFEKTDRTNTMELSDVFAREQ